MDLDELLAQHAELRRRWLTNGSLAVDTDLFWWRTPEMRIRLSIAEQPGSEGHIEFTYDTTYIQDGTDDLPAHSFVDGGLLSTARLRRWLLEIDSSWPSDRRR
ncbi:hypothetical protein [Plantibacter sp. CFBP 8775]|uniref:hypothetical protein n=1 Tax=Plantibacter sp. CFBP 8775 TaxID=2774038 RepID=UPI001784FCF4|nr:hypothetical protein [Plantibacter sp. CFBP 8775]MBD8104787.1 hypothetical protein [Plantibacter sp. CFBP 8775]